MHEHFFVNDGRELFLGDKFVARNRDTCMACQESNNCKVKTKQKKEKNAKISRWILNHVSLFEKVEIRTEKDLAHQKCVG